jgi:hypothetical protein
MKWARNHLTDHQKRILEQANMLLNLQPNMNQLYENVGDTFRIFADILKKHGATETFGDSLKNSHHYITQLPSYNHTLPKENHFSCLNLNMDCLKPGKTDSFLIIPFSTNDHVFTGILRKIHKKINYRFSQEQFSLLIVNLGSRPNERGQEPSHIEFIFSDRAKIESFLKFTGKKSLNFVEEFYVELNQKSDERFNLNLKAREQVIGNCFTKEFEKGIKTALLDYDQINKAKQDQPFLKASFENTIHQSTYEIHKAYIEQLKRENENDSQLIEALNKAFFTYTINKDLRNRMRGIPPLIENFRPERSLSFIDTRNLYQLRKDQISFRRAFGYVDQQTYEKLNQTVYRLAKVEYEVGKILNTLHMDSDVEKKVDEYMSFLQKVEFKRYAPTLYSEKTLELCEKLDTLTINCINNANREFTKGLSFLENGQSWIAYRHYKSSEEAFLNGIRFQKLKMDVDKRSMFSLQAKEIIYKNLSINLIAQAYENYINNNNLEKALDKCKKAYHMYPDAYSKNAYQDFIEKTVLVAIHQNDIEKTLKYSNLLLEIDPENGAFKEKIATLQNELLMKEEMRGKNMEIDRDHEDYPMAMDSHGAEATEILRLMGKKKKSNPIAMRRVKTSAKKMEIDL